MKRTTYAFGMFITIISVSLCGCGKKSDTAKKTSQKISVIDNDIEKANTTSGEVYTKEEVEDIVKKALEEADKKSVEEAAPSTIDEASTVEPDQYDTSENDSMTTEQKNAVKAASDYLSFSSFSHKGLVDQLSSEYGNRYPKDVAEFAVCYLEDNGMVDWNEQAGRVAKEYLDLTSFSREALIEQLTSEYGSQFTQEQAEYAVRQIGY